MQLVPNLQLGNAYLRYQAGAWEREMEQLSMTQLSEWISPDYHFGFEELCLSANISSDNIIELIDYNIITPISGKQPQEWQFNITAMRIVNKAARLHRDLEIDWADIGLILNLLDDIEYLRSENAQLKLQLKRFLF